jgi:hypothetical protein
MRIERLITVASRPQLIGAVESAEIFSRFLLQGPRRTLPQNRMMWRLLSLFADQVEHGGRHYDEEVWKCIAMHALGRQMEFVPGFDGEIVGLGYRSAELSKEEMSDLIELLFSEGARLGVDFEATPGMATPGLAMRGEAGRGTAGRRGAR